jgi:endoglucanase
MRLDWLATRGLLPLGVALAATGTAACLTEGWESPGALTPRNPTVAASRKGGAVKAPAFTKEMKPCTNGLIDDLEDNDNRIEPLENRSGYWFSYVDSQGTTLSPSPFSMTPEGANGSKYAVHVSGKMGASGNVFAGVGFNFMEPKQAYDATAYKGISLRAKSAPGASTHAVRLKVGDVNTSPEGKVCKDKCYNDFGADLTLTDDWTKYSIPFKAMTQQPGWGDPRPKSIDVSQLFGVQFAQSETGATYDVWVDDIQFVCE